MGIKHSIDVLNSFLASSLNLGRGLNSVPAAKKPKLPLQLYDMEGSPFCRLVREALTELDLEVEIFPCPKGGKRFRAQVKKLGGKEQFPFLVDPNTGKQIYESADIIAYLFKTYGRRPLPLKWRVMPIQKVSSIMAYLVRPRRGLKNVPTKAPRLPLELYSFELSPFARIAREALCELEIPYLLHNVGKQEIADFVFPGPRKKFLPKRGYKGISRKNMAERAGKVMVPFLVDPNTGVQMFESADIVKYLKKTYATH